MHLSVVGTQCLRADSWQALDRADHTVGTPIAFYECMSIKRAVSEIMTRDLLVVEEFENLKTVAMDMERGHFRHLPVIDGVFGQGGRLVGLLSHRDLLKFSASAIDPYRGRVKRDNQLKEETFVGMVMTRDVETVKPNTPIAEAVRSLLAARFGCLPVVDDDNVLLGIVSEVDLLQLLSGMLNLEEQTQDSGPGSVHRTPSVNPTR